MDNNIKNEVRDFKDLPDCFIRKNAQYNPNVKRLNLPVVPAKYIPILDKWGVAYEMYQIEKRGETLEYCRYWDRRKYEEQEMELPVYEYKHFSKIFKYVGTHKGKLPTKASVDAAYKLKKNVDEDITKQRTRDKIAYLRFCMDGRAAAYFDSSEFKAPFEEGDLDNFTIFVLKKDDKSNHIIVFDCDLIYDGRDVTLYLPAEYLEEIVGVEQENAERWVEVLNLDSNLIIDTY